MYTRMSNQMYDESVWNNKNPILGYGELGISNNSDGTMTIKCGDGETQWTNLQDLSGEAAADESRIDISKFTYWQLCDLYDVLTTDEIKATFKIGDFFYFKRLLDINIETSNPDTIIEFQNNSFETFANFFAKDKKDIYTITRLNEIEYFHNWLYGGNHIGQLANIEGSLGIAITNFNENDTISFKCTYRDEKVVLVKINEVENGKPKLIFMWDDMPFVLDYRTYNPLHQYLYIFKNGLPAGDYYFYTGIGTYPVYFTFTTTKDIPPMGAIEGWFNNIGPGIEYEFLVLSYGEDNEFSDNFPLEIINGSKEQHEPTTKTRLPDLTKGQVYEDSEYIMNKTLSVQGGFLINQYGYSYSEYMSDYLTSSSQRFYPDKTKINNEIAKKLLMRAHSVDQYNNEFSYIPGFLYGICDKSLLRKNDYNYIEGDDPIIVNAELALPAYSYYSDTDKSFTYKKYDIGAKYDGSIIKTNLKKCLKDNKIYSYFTNIYASYAGEATMESTYDFSGNVWYHNSIPRYGICPYVSIC